MTDLQTRRSATGSGPPRPSQLRPSPRGSQSAHSLARLAVVIAAAVALAVVTHATDVLIVVVALVAMVMLHELGHFATAKWSHMKVTEYFLGFGPKLWSVRKGETEYGIKAIPAGGYVKILGMANTEEVDPADEARTYRQQPFHNRFIVAVAGSAMHAVMAFVLIWVLLVVVGTPTTVGAQVSSFAPLSHGVDPASAAGLRVGDVIIAVNGHKVGSADQMVSEVSPRPGRRLDLEVDRHGRILHVFVTPVAVHPNSASHEGRIGVEITDAAGPASHADPAVAVGRSVIDLGRTVGASVAALGQVFSANGISDYIHDLTSAKAANQAAKSGKRIESIYGAARIATEAARAGAGPLIEVLVAINVFVGMVNLLPMLPLDGGHVAIAVYERIRSRRGHKYHADVMKLMLVAYAFVLFLGFIVLTSLYLDITHPVSNPFG